MIREVPPLVDMLLKIIAKQPSKCLKPEKCEKLWQASKAREHYFRYRGDIVQDVISHIIEAGRMTDDAVPVVLYKGRDSALLANSKISGNYVLYVTID